MAVKEFYDVLIIGGGLAGLTLARQLLRSSDKTILLVDRNSEIPPTKQKVGESLVQVGGYYFSKVLDLEEYLLREHYMKYNLRFYWKTPGKENRSFEDYSQAYIRAISNIPCYQLDRNKIEGELLRLNQQEHNFAFLADIHDLRVVLSESGCHETSFKIDDREVSVRSEWVVDASGRRRFLARQLDLAERSPIHHGAAFLWVEGLVDIDKLTDLSPKELRLKKDRRATGHLPIWLATNHFMGEGFWFWVIPLQGKTSLGLVFDNRLIPHERVSNPQKLLNWACEEFPLFTRDLPSRKVLDFGSYKSFAHDCGQAIHPSRWAMSGEAGRFTDPLYSPGSDFIAFHNTLIVDAIMTRDSAELVAKCRIYDLLMQAIYLSLLPTYAVSYDTLGDQDAFVLKYTWELSVYFTFFVFPFINDLSTDQRFVMSYLVKFSRLGAINHQLQSFLSAYYQWRKSNQVIVQGPVLHDFTEIGTLRSAERMFYEVGRSVDEALTVLDTQLDNLKELARFIVAHITSVITAEPRALTNKQFVENIDLKSLHFNPAALSEQYQAYAACTEPYAWSFNPSALEKFRAVSSNKGR